MDNLIKFETADRPMTTRGGFPYEEIIKSLKALASTKAIVCSEKELTVNRITHLRNIAKKQGLEKVFVARKNGKVYVWSNCN